MTKTPQNDIIAGPQAVDLHTPEHDEPVSNQTATILRALCDKVGEPFDGALTELQARARIALLEEKYDVSATD